MPREQIPDLEGAKTVYGVKLPTWWIQAIDTHCLANHVTRERFVSREVVSRNLELGQISDMAAAKSLGMSKSQYVRDTLEKAHPDLCPPIKEWRGNGGSRYSEAHSKPTLKVRLTPEAMAALEKIRADYISRSDTIVEPTLEQFASAALAKWINAYVARTSTLTNP
jgi:hypothetical protein